MLSWIKSLFTPKARASSQRVPDRIWELAENQPLSLDAQLAVANGRMSMDSVQQAVREGVRKYREQAGTNPVAAWALSFVDPYTWANDTPDFYPGWGVGGGMVPWMLNNQGVGDALPVYINEYGLKLIRDWSRKQLQFNEFAINAVENRINYIVGKGMQYTILPKKRAEVSPKDHGGMSGPKKLAAMAQEVLDEFIVRERWNEREQEIVRRCDRDGESFIRFFHVGNGRCSVRFVEPEYVTDGKATLTDKYGIQTEDDDVERPIAYQVVERPTADWVVEPVPAEEILHIKLNTDFTSKRGLPTFFPVRKNLERAEKLLRNMSVMAQVQATFSVIRKHKQFSPSSVSAYQQQQVTLATQNAISGQPVNLQQYYPGSVIDTSDKTEYEFPSAGVDGSGLVQILDAELRAIASRLVMTDWMLTASSQGANVSTALVAGAPCVENFKRMQAFYARRFGDGCYPAPIAGGDSVAGAMWRVLAIAVDGGLLPDEVLTDLEIQAEGPSITVVNKVAESNRARVLYESGILSGETWAKWEGLDYQQELSLGAKPEKAVPGDEGREGGGFGREMPSNPGDRMTGGQSDDGGDETRENVKDDSGHEHGADGKFTGSGGVSSKKSKLAASKKKIADAAAALRAARDEAVEHILGDISELQDRHDEAVSELKKISKIKRGEGSSDESSEEYKELVDVYGQLTDMIQDYKELHVDMKAKDKVNALEDIRDSSLALADLLKEDGRPDSEVEFAKELSKNATAAAKSIRGIYRARRELKDIKSGKITESVATILGENVEDDSGHEHGNDGKFVGKGGAHAGSKSRKKKPEMHGKTKSGQKIEFTTPPHMNGRKLVMVDPAKLSKAWEKDKKNYLPPEQSGEKGGSEVGGRRQNFKDFLKKGKPVEASTVFLTKDGEASFVDGRHRFAVMRDMGIDRVAVAVDKKQASKFEKEFGAE